MSNAQGIKAARAYVEFGADLESFDKAISEAEGKLKEAQRRVKDADAQERRISKSEKTKKGKEWKEANPDAAWRNREIITAAQVEAKAQRAAAERMVHAARLRRDNEAERRVENSNLEKQQQKQKQIEVDRRNAGAQNAKDYRVNRFTKIDEEAAEGRRALAKRLEAYKNKPEQLAAKDQAELERRVTESISSEYQKRLDKTRAYYDSLREMAHGNAEALKKIKEAESIALDKVLDEETANPTGGGGTNKGLMRSLVASIGRAGKRIANIGGGSAPAVAGALGIKIGSTVAEYQEDRSVAAIKAIGGELDANARVTEKWISKLEAIPLIGDAIRMSFAGIHDENQRMIDRMERPRLAAEKAFQERPVLGYGLQDATPKNPIEQQRIELQRYKDQTLGKSGINNPESLSRQLADAQRALAAAQAEQAAYDAKVKSRAGVYVQTQKISPASAEKQARYELGPRPDVGGPATDLKVLEEKKQVIDETIAAMEAEIKRQEEYIDVSAEAATKQATSGAASAGIGARYERLRGTQANELAEARRKATLKTGPADQRLLLMNQAADRRVIDDERYDQMRNAQDLQQQQEKRDAKQRMASPTELQELDNTQTQERLQLERNISQEKARQQAIDDLLVNEEAQKFTNAQLRLKLFKEQMQGRTTAAGIDDKYVREWGELKKSLESDPLITPQDVAAAKVEYDKSVVAQKEQDRRSMSEDYAARIESAKQTDPVAKDFIAFRRKMKTDGQSDTDIKAMEAEHRKALNAEFLGEQTGQLPGEQFLRYMKRLDEVKGDIPKEQYYRLQDMAAGSMLPKVGVSTQIGQSVFAGANTKTEDALNAMIKSERHLAAIASRGGASFGP